MADFKILALLTAALAATIAVASPARGQCRLCEKPTTAGPQSPVEDGIELSIETSLDFDRLVLDGSGQGAALIRPDGSTAVEGALTGVSPRAMVGTAVVRGIAGRALRVELPRRIDLYSVSGGHITVDDVASDLPSIPRLDAAGSLEFRFGGRVTVTGDAEGAYRGDMPITVEYQ
jgi:hypothetical protein